MFAKNASARSDLLHFMDFPTLPQGASSYNLLQNIVVKKKSSLSLELSLKRAFQFVTNQNSSNTYEIGTSAQSHLLHFAILFNVYAGQPN